MTPRLSIIAAAIRRVLNTLAGDIGTYADDYWSSVVLALRGNTPSDPFWANTSLLMHADEADPYWGNVVLGMHMGGGEVDPYWSNVSLLMLMNGTNGSTAIGDVTGKTVTVFNGAAISTSQSKFGGASCYFDGTNDCVNVGSLSDYDISSSDFTIECWVYPTASARSVISRRSTGANGWVLTTIGMRATINGSWSDYQLSWSQPTLNQWHHMAWVRSGTTIYGFVDGILMGVKTGVTSIHDQAEGLLIGAGSNADIEYPFSGYIDNVRFTKGVARYTDTFDPPRKEFPAGATTVYDVKGHPVSVNGNAAIVATQSRFGGYSCYFDGSGDYLHFADHTDWAFGSGDFTVEFFTRCPSYTNSFYISQWSSSDMSFSLSIGTSGEIAFQLSTTGAYQPGNVAVSANGAVQINKWQHIAFVRYGNLFSIYVDGVSVASLTAAITLYDSSLPLYIGCSGTGNYFNGYLDDIRVTKGVARYTAAFTPPARAFPHDVPFVDEKGKYPVVAGTPSISTTTPKFGGATASFNGTTDYLTFDAHADFGLGTGDYTVEGWIKTSAVGVLLDTRNYAADYGLFYIATGGYLAHDHTYGALVGTISVTDDTWHHVAFVRYNNILTMYVDGKDSGSYISNANLGSLRQARIGAKVDGTGFYSGLMDELRVTKGVARYVSEFTPQAYAIADSNNNLLLQDETGTNSVASLGNASVNSTAYKFGNGAVYFDGTGDALVIPHSAALQMGSSNFTFECWVNIDVGSSGYRGIYAKRSSNSTWAEFSVHIDNTNNLQFIATSNGYSWLMVITTPAPANGVWNHIACVRNGNVFTLFVNGAVAGTPVTWANTLWASTENLAIGALGTNGDYPFKGYLDDIRITKGVARYISTFTPPARENANYGKPTQYDPYWDAVVLGMHMDDVGLTDVKGKTVTLNGNVTRSATQSKFGGYSAYFDGTGDFLSTPDSPHFDLGAGDFTIEAWVYPASIASTMGIVGKQRGAASYGEYVFSIASGGSFGFAATTGGEQVGGWNLVNISGSGVVAAMWQHLAVTRSGDTFRIFLQGTLVSSTTATGAITDGTSLLTVGSNKDDGSYGFNGYIDDLRITKGVARYTANFQPAQYAFPETRTPVKTYVDPWYDNVVLNMHFNGPNGSTAFVDEKGKVVTANGNAALSTTQSKFGGSSCYFDGTGDYLTLASNTAFGFGTDDFTVEAHILITGGQGTDRNITDFRVSSGSDIGTFFIDGPTNKLAFWYGVKLGASGTALTTGVWYHVVLSRTSGTFYCFLNGTLDWISAASVDFGSARTLTIGASTGSGIVGNGPFAGYIDDLRITKGVARYTQNFTVPALPNPDYKVAPAPTDLYWKNVVLHMPMNGADNGTTFTENTGKTVTVTGDTKTKVAQYRFGGSSAYFDGSGDYLTVPYTAASFDWWTSDFTVECWVYYVTLTNAHYVDGPNWNPVLLGCMQPTTYNNAWSFGALGDGKLKFYYYNGAAQGVATAGAVITAGTWNHLAMTKTSSGITLWVNGVAVISTTAIVGTPTNQSITTLTLGQCANTAVNAYVDDLRITRGVARYTANFVPPSLPNPTGYDPYAPNVVLHLPMNADFTDGTGKAVTANGGATISTTIKKFGAGSGYFDGASSLRLYDGGDWTLTEDFTIEAWVKVLSLSSNMGVVSHWYSGIASNCAFALKVRSSGTLEFSYGQGGTNVGVIGTTAGPVVLGGWAHIAVTRSGSTVRMFVNGVQDATTATVSGALNDCPDGLGIGVISVDRTPSDYLNGYIDDLRITKGVARYTADFVPPKEPFSLT